MTRIDDALLTLLGCIVTRLPFVALQFAHSVLTARCHTRLCWARVDNATPMGSTCVDHETKVSGLPKTSNAPRKQQKMYDEAQAG